MIKSISMPDILDPAMIVECFEEINLLKKIKILSVINLIEAND